MERLCLGEFAEDSGPPFYAMWFVPLGEYQKVDLVVQDDFGEQAECRVGKISVQP